MSEVFEAKLRKVGSSFGVLIPNKVVKRNGKKLGETVKLSMLEEDKEKAIREGFGLAKGSGEFKRPSSFRKFLDDI